MKMVLLPFLLSRALILAIFIGARGMILIPDPSGNNILLNPELRLSSEKIVEALSQIMKQSDVSWYLGIAAHGYTPPPFNPAVQQSWCFFPAWPAVLWLSDLLTSHSVLCGFVLANVLFLFSLCIIFRICEQEGYSESIASSTIWLLCFFPTSYFFSLPMTESLFLFLTTGSILLLQRDRTMFSAAAFAVSTATRPTGLLLLPAFWAAIFRAKTARRRLKLIAALLAPIGLIAFMTFTWTQIGEPLAFIKGQKAWDRGNQGLLSLLAELGRDPLLILRPWNFIWLNIAATVLCFAASAYWWTKHRYDYLLYCLLPTVAPLLTGTVLSISRFTLLFFPVFIALGSWTRTRERELSLLAIFATLLALMCVFLARGGNVAMT